MKANQFSGSRQNEAVRTVFKRDIVLVGFGRLLSSLPAVCWNETGIEENRQL